MNCSTCERILSAYIDDELTNEARLEVEAHFDTCERCRKDYESHLLAWEAAGGLRTGSAPEGLWRAVESEVQQKGTATTTEELALVVRGLAGEVRDLKQAVESLRADLESELTEAQEGDSERVRRFHQLRVWSETPSRVESAR